MKEQKIVVEISAEGKLTANAEGFAGDACIKEIEALLGDLAAEVEKVERHGDPRTASIGATKIESLRRKQ
ncbi:MAG: DUF2997 domain-containing protein [Candidatus Sumerlaeia bacterium]|nr:DUF2997 domain-containing protein [Candidatus Sumerlaeia bacterium]